MILVVQNKDTKFYKIDDVEREVTIPQERLSIKDKTVIQLLIKAKEDISFSNNEDLNGFYQHFKENIEVPKNDR